MPSDYAAIERENEIRRGTDFEDIGRFFSEQLYGDRAHFVLELLQNAEDAIARRVQRNPASTFPRRVTFDLFSDRLEVRHFGIPFDEVDVRGVCDILQGTKSNDAMQIGKFGIGFKSVFSVTSTPEIHSGDERFHIIGYIRPREVNPREKLDAETLLVFPFNSPGLAPMEAYDQVRDRLQQLGPRTLLFLRYIDEIHWTIDDCQNGLYLRNVISLPGARQVRVLGESGVVEQDETWLVFERSTEANESVPSARVEIAFNLRSSDDPNVQSIAAISRSELVVYFPTRRETHLGFLLQGPFATTPARDNILENAWNDHLIQEAATLLDETLPVLRDMGYMSVELLEALPISADQFPLEDFFRPLFDQVQTSLTRQPLLPTESGHYIPATQAKLARSSELRRLLTDDQLRGLFPESTEPTWLTGEITQDRTPALRLYLMQSLSVEELVADNLSGRFNLGFLERQSDGWLTQFYAFLNHQEALWRAKRGAGRPGPLREQPIIRLESGDHVAPFSSEGAPMVYLPPDGSTEFPTVRRALVDDEDALEFLQRLGLSLPDIVDEVLERVLPKYQGKTVANQLLRVSDTEHHDDISKIVRALARVTKQERLRSRLAETRFLMSENAGSGLRDYETPTNVYIRSDGLEMYFEGNTAVWFIDPRYEEWPPLINELKIASTVRIQRRLPNLQGMVNIARDHGKHKRGLQGFDPDFGIDGLEHAIDLISIDKARFVWNHLLSPNSQQVRGVVETSSRQTFEASTRKATLSRMGELATSRAWLPSKDGRFHKPSKLTFDQLPSDFDANDHLAAVLAGTLSENSEKGVGLTGLLYARVPSDRIRWPLPDMW